MQYDKLNKLNKAASDLHDILKIGKKNMDDLQSQRTEAQRINALKKVKPVNSNQNLELLLPHVPQSVSNNRQPRRTKIDGISKTSFGFTVPKDSTQIQQKAKRIPDPSKKKNDIEYMFVLFDRYLKQELTKQDEYESLLKLVKEYINADTNSDKGMKLRLFLLGKDNNKEYETAISVMKGTKFYFDPNITIKKRLHKYLYDLYRDFEILKESLNNIRKIIDPGSNEIEKSTKDVKIAETFLYSNFVECMKTKIIEFLFILTLKFENLVKKIEKKIDVEILDIVNDKLKMDNEIKEITNKMLNNVRNIEIILELSLENFDHQGEKNTYDKFIKDYKPLIFNILGDMQACFAFIDYFIHKAYLNGIFNDNEVKILITNMENLQYFIEHILLIHKDLIKSDERIEFQPTLSYFIQLAKEDEELDKILNDEKFNGGRRNHKKKPKKNPTKLNRGADMNMKDIRGLCKVNQIKLSKTKDGVRVIYTKKELITKLKRKKIL
jgi:hypothetical protein